MSSDVRVCPHTFGVSWWLKPRLYSSASSTHTHTKTHATPRTANGRGLRTVRPIDPRSSYRGQHNVLGRTCVSSHVWCFLAVKTSVV